MPVLRENDVRRGGTRAFTLVELILVMVLLGIAAALVTPHMVTFFHGRVLMSEARRMLALTRYGESRAVSEGAPVLLWVDGTHSTYGLTVQAGPTAVDQRATVYTVDPTLSLEAISPSPMPTSEEEDERLGVPGNVPAIRFMPDGTYDQASIAKIVIHQGTEAAVELVPTENRLGYEIEPYKAN